MLGEAVSDVCSLFQVDGLIWIKLGNIRCNAPSFTYDAHLSGFLFLEEKTKLLRSAICRIVVSHSSECVGLNVHSGLLRASDQNYIMNYDRISLGKYECFGLDCQG